MQTGKIGHQKHLRKGRFKAIRGHFWVLDAQPLFYHQRFWVPWAAKPRSLGPKPRSPAPKWSKTSKPRPKTSKPGRPKGPEGPLSPQRARRALWARAPRARLHQNTTPTESRNDIARNSFARVWGRRHLRSALLNLRAISKRLFLDLGQKLVPKTFPK